MDERYKFVRSINPFENLKDYDNSLELILEKKILEYPLQLDFLGLASNNGKELTTVLGHYYEILTQGICGGTIKNRRISDSIELDLFNCERNSLQEIKATSPGEGIILGDEQIRKYVRLQLDDSFAEPPKVVFNLYRHGIRKLIKSFGKKALEDLIKELSLSTKFMLSLPFSVVTAIHNSDCKYCSVYDGEMWTPYTRFLSSGLNAMLAYPEKTLQEFGLNPEDFKIQKIKFPLGVKINGIKITSFPILIVTDKDHEKWTEEFRKGFGKEYLDSTQEVNNPNESEDDEDISFPFGSNLK